MQENQRLELKCELNERFERSVVSFLNYTGGGEILIGVNHNGNAVGVVNPDEEQLKIVDRIRNNIRPQTLGLFDVVHDKINDKDVIRVIVSCGQQRPYYIRKFGMSEQGCFVRVGSSSQPMSEQMIEEFIAKRQQITLQTMLSPRQNLTFKQLRIYYQEKNLEPTEQFIESLDFRQSDGQFNYVAYLFADSNGVSIKIAVYAGTDKVDLLETREYGNTCLITATQKILDRLDSENRTFAKITSKKRLEKERVNTIALREAVINGIAHNDYSKGVPLVEIFSDRIVVTSCGGLVDGLTEEDFFKCRSMPRNREIMRLFRDMELVEQIGSGMSRILKAYNRSIFEITPSFTVVTLPFEKSLITPNDKINEGNDKINEGNDKINEGNDKINEGNDKINEGNDKINEVTKTILDLIKDNPTTTISQLIELTGKSQSTISRELREYQDAGLLWREGARKKGRWVVR